MDSKIVNIISFLIVISAPELLCGPTLRNVPMESQSLLTLPSNATSIRAEISDNFSCDNRTYGYYADVDNACQVFHVCLPVTYADGKEQTFRWSFICPEETVFNQENFSCVRYEDLTIDCLESEKFYKLNSNFGNTDSEDGSESEVRGTTEQGEPTVQFELPPGETNHIDAVTPVDVDTVARNYPIV